MTLSFNSLGVIFTKSLKEIPCEIASIRVIILLGFLGSGLSPKSNPTAPIPTPKATLTGTLATPVPPIKAPGIAINAPISLYSESPRSSSVICQAAPPPIETFNVPTPVTKLSVVISLAVFLRA